jgi:hypothetical protein
MLMYLHVKFEIPQYPVTLSLQMPKESHYLNPQILATTSNMHEEHSLPSQAIESCSYSTAEGFKKLAKEKVQQTQPVLTKYSDEPSPAATSEPISIPSTTTQHLLGNGRVHHSSDIVTDYGLPDGWEDCRRQRLKNREKEIGRILIGNWTPVSTWKKSKVVRKDPDFTSKQDTAKKSNRINR